MLLNRNLGCFTGIFLWFFLVIASFFCWISRGCCPSLDLDGDGVFELGAVEFRAGSGGGCACQRRRSQVWLFFVEFCDFDPISLVFMRNFRFFCWEFSWNVVISCLGCLFCSQNGKFSYGYASSPGKRSSMEDFYETRIDGVDGEIVGLFGVFDGIIFLSVCRSLK